MSPELREAMKELTGIFQSGYVDNTEQEGNFIWTEDRDFSKNITYNIENQTIAIPSASGLIKDTVLTIDEARELIDNPKDLIRYTICIQTILSETITVKNDRWFTNK